MDAYIATTLIIAAALIATAITRTPLIQITIVHKDEPPTSTPTAIDVTRTAKALEEEAAKEGLDPRLQ